MVIWTTVLCCWVLLAACLPPPVPSTPAASTVVPRSRDAASLPRVAYVWPGLPPTGVPFIDVFRDSLTEYGWTDGTNIFIDAYSVDRQVERYPHVVAEVVASRPNVIVVGDSAAAPIVAAATAEIPVVLTVGGNLVAAGQACAFNRPCGNITGLSMTIEPLSPKRLEMLKEIAPSVRRVGFLRNAGIPETQIELEAVQRVAAGLGVDIVPLQFHTPADFASTFQEALDNEIDGLVVMPDSVTVLHRAPILRFTSENRLPDAYGVKNIAADGGLFAYGADRFYNFRRAAFYVDRILRGTSPADLPIEQPAQFELVINLGRARQLDLTVPRSMQLRANEVLQ